MKRRLTIPREPTWSYAAQVKCVAHEALFEALDNTGYYPYMLGIQPFTHQLACWHIGLQHRSWYFALDPGTGKALPNDTPVLRDDGTFTPIGDLRIGDLIASADGGTQRVEGVYPQGKKEAWRVTFKDGSHTDCCDDHLWTVDTRAAGKWMRRTMSTKDLRTLGTARADHGLRFSVPIANVEPAEPTSPSLNPYLLGVLLGDGHIKGPNLSVTADKRRFEKTWLDLYLPKGSKRPRIYDRKGTNARTFYFTAEPLRAILTDLGLYGKGSTDKFIPEECFRYSRIDRISLLQGLMDTDGYNSKGSSSGTLQFDVSCCALAEDMRKLVFSLGGMARTNVRETTHHDSYRSCINLHTDISPYRHDRFKMDGYQKQGKYQPRRFIESIEPLPFLQYMTCVKVSDESGLFVVTDGYVVTHNTASSLGIYAIRRMLGEVRRCIVAVPNITAQLTWQHEVAKWTPFSCEVVRGSARVKRKLLWSSDADFVVVSFPWLRKYLSQQRSPHHFDEAFQMLVLDESHIVKNPESVGFRMCAQHFDPGRMCVYLLSGTPIGHNYYDVWSQYYLIDRGVAYGADFDAFRDYYFHMRVSAKGLPYYVLRKQTQSVFFDRFWISAARWQEEECVSLPEKVYNVVPCELTPAQRELYEARLGSPDPYAYMRITAGTHPEAHTPISSGKLEALFFLLEQYAHEPVVIWHWLQTTGELLEQVLAKRFAGRRLAAVRQGVSDRKRETILNAFLASEIGLLIANPGSFGESVNLIAARVAVYYEQPPILIRRIQSEKRIHRTGQQRACYYYDLLTTGSVDELAYDRMQKRRDAFTGFTRDQVSADIRKVYLGGRNGCQSLAA